MDKLHGREDEIFKQRDEKLAKARQRCAEQRRALKKQGDQPINPKSDGGYGTAEEQPERQSDRREYDKENVCAG